MWINKVNTYCIRIYYRLLFSVIIFVILPIFMLFIYALWNICHRQKHKQKLLPIKKYYASKRKKEENEECTICLEDFMDKDELRVLPCNHQFHIICIDSWLTTRHKFVRSLYCAMFSHFDWIGNHFVLFVVSVLFVRETLFHRQRKHLYKTKKLWQTYNKFLNIKWLEEIK